MRLEHKAGVDIIYELALRLYPSSLESFREAISNSLDEGSKKIEVLASLKEVVLEDWGKGIESIETFRTFGQYTKEKLGGEIIGMKGLGKLSLLRLGKNVNFRTNNGEIGHNIIMTPEYLEVDTKAKERFLQHQGTQVIVPNPVEVPPTDELSHYLKKVFGLHLAKGLEIILNGAKLTSKVDASERFLFRIKGGHDVTGNLKQDKKGQGSVDVYVKHVFVMSILVDPERNFSGWVNCNPLIPATARNDLVKDNLYNDFLDHLREYVAQHFPRREEDVSKEEILLGNELSKLLQRYLSQMQLLPKGLMPIGRGKDEVKNARERKEPKEPEPEKPKPKEEPSEYEKLHTSTKTDKPIKRIIKTAYGMKWIDQNAGNEKEPIFFVEPNLIIRNRTNDLYKFALKSKTSLGPRWLRMLPYLSRVAVGTNPKNKGLAQEQTNLEIDKASRFFLKLKNEI